MYKIVKQRRAWWPVKWSAPAEDGGELVHNQIELRFRLLKVEGFVAWEREAEAIRARMLDPSADAGGTVVTVFAEVVERIAEDWRGVSAENGEPLPWSRDNLVMLLNEPGLFVHILTAYRDCVAGRQEARAGN